MTWELVQLRHSDRELSVYATEAYYEGPASRLRRFTYRVDGFVSARATDGCGQLLTKPLLFDGDRLHVNFTPFDRGSLRAELQDAEGDPIRGFTLGDCLAVSGDEIDEVLTWNGQADVGSLSEAPVRVLFQLEDVDLYSFQFKAAPL